MQEDEISDREARVRAARGTLMLLTRHAVVRGMAFVGTLFLARLIAPHTFGIFAITQFVLNLCSSASVGGVIAALVRKKERVVADEYHTAFALQQMVGVFVFVCVVIATPFIRDAYDLTSNQQYAFPAMGAAVFLLSLRSIPVAMLQRSLKHDRVAMTEVVEYLVYIGVSLGLAWAGLGLYALVIATLVRYLASVVLLHLMVKQWPRLLLRMEYVRAILQIAVPLQVTILLDLGQRSVVPVVLGKFFGAAAVGLVSMASTILDSLIMQPITMLATIQFRLLARSQDDRERFASLLGNIYFVMGATAIPIAVALAICAPTLIPLVLPGKWHEVGHLIQWITIASLFQLVAHPTSQAFKALGDTLTPMLNSPINLLVQAAVLLLLRDRMGLDSYPIALACGGVAATLFMIYRLGRHLRRLPPLNGLVEVIAATAAGLGVCLLVMPVLDRWRVAATLMFVLVYMCALLVLSGERLAKYFRLASTTLFDSRVRLKRVLESCAAVSGRSAAVGHRLTGRRRA